MAAECRFFGIDPAAMSGVAVEYQPSVVWPDMRDAFALFCAMSTQWHWTGAGFGAFQTGLNYAVLRETALSIGIKLAENGALPGHVFSDIRTLESEALATWAKRRK